MDNELINYLSSKDDKILDIILSISREGILISRKNLINHYSKKNRLPSIIRKELISFGDESNKTKDKKLIFEKEEFKPAINEIIANNLKINEISFVRSTRIIKEEQPQQITIDIDKYTVNGSPLSNKELIEFEQLKEVEKEEEEEENKEISIIELIPNQNGPYFSRQIPLEILDLISEDNYGYIIINLNHTISNVHIYLGILFLSLLDGFIMCCFSSTKYRRNIGGIVVGGTILLYVIFLIWYGQFRKTKRLISHTVSQNKQLLKENIQLEFHIIFKEINYPKTKYNFTLEIHYKNNTSKSVKDNNLPTSNINEIDV